MVREPKIIANSYFHYVKTIYKRISSSQLAKEAQIAKIKCFRKKLLRFWEKLQNQPEGPPKQEDEGECFAQFLITRVKSLQDNLLELITC